MALAEDHQDALPLLRGPQVQQGERRTGVGANGPRVEAHTPVWCVCKRVWTMSMPLLR